MMAFSLAPNMVGLIAGSLGQHMVPLLSLAAEQRCFLALQDQDRDAFTVPAPRPWVVIIGDDPADPATSLGPQGFHTRSVAGLLRASHDVSLIACEILPAIYERAAALAATGLSSVVIETRPEHEPAWSNFVELVAPGKLRTRGLVGPTGRAR